MTRQNGAYTVLRDLGVDLTGTENRELTTRYGFAGARRPSVRHDLSSMPELRHCVDLAHFVRWNEHYLEPTMSLLDERIARLTPSQIDQRTY